MRKKKNDGGHAFPRALGSIAVGMTLRDYFAAHTLPTIIDHDIHNSGADGFFSRLKILMSSLTRVERFQERWEDYARQAFEMADAMIAERDKNLS